MGFRAVGDGSLIICKEGIAPTVVKADLQAYLGDSQRLVVANDNKPGNNISSFGLCKLLEKQAGVPMPCDYQPSGCWSPVSSTIVKGVPLVPEIATLKCAVGGSISVLLPLSTVFVGVSTAGMTDDELLELLMQMLRTSEWAKTEEGKRVMAALEEVYADGRLQIIDVSAVYLEDAVGVWDASNEMMSLDRAMLNDDIVFSSAVLVHEGTHAADYYDGTRDGYTTEGEAEVPAFSNELDYYSELQDKEYVNEEEEHWQSCESVGRLEEAVTLTYEAGQMLDCTP